jgi:hypothetical protein
MLLAEVNHIAGDTDPPLIFDPLFKRMTRRMIADDPRKMATILIKENGLDGAHHITMTEITRANEERDYYNLSIWREIRNFVRDQMEPEEIYETGEPVL